MKNIEEEIENLAMKLEENMLFKGEIDYQVNENCDGNDNTYSVHNLFAEIDSGCVMLIDDKEDIINSFLINSISDIIDSSDTFIIYLKSGQTITLKY